MRTVFLIIVVLCVLKVNAQQNYSPDRFLGNLLEDIRDNSEDDDINVQGIEDLVELYENPFNVNGSVRSDWEKLVFLTAFQIDRIMEFLHTNTVLASPYQLQGVKGLDVKTIEKINLFVVFKPVEIKSLAARKTLRGKIITREMFTTEKARGYSNDSTISGYVGDRQHLYSKLELDYGDDFSAGMVADKDPGEAFMQRGYDAVDFISGYIMYEGKKSIKRVVLGDYAVNFGQGLSIWSGTSIGKTSSGTGVMKNGGLNKYSSANESQFFRGGAVGLSLKNVSVDIFYSRKKIDSDLSYDDISGVSYITSLPVSGYHRTSSELKKKNNLQETVMGTNVRYRYRNLEIYTGIFTYNLAVDSVGYAYAYKKYAHVSPDSRYGWGGIKYGGSQFVCFGELALDNELNPALIAGIELNPAKTLSLSLMYRCYHNRYFSPLFGGFSNYSTPNGEQGVFLTGKFLPVEKIAVTGYVDLYTVEAIKYNMDRPSQGYSLSVELNYSCNPKLNLAVKYKETEKSLNTTGEGEADFWVGETNLKRIRTESCYHINKTLELINRIEYAYYIEKDGSSSGLLSYAELGYKKPDGLLTLWLRYTYFNTDDYDSRIYTYEHDLLYNFYTPAFQDVGSRLYFSLKWKVSKRVDFWFKTGRIWYNNKEEIGSGLQLLKGSAKTNIKMQLQVKF